MIGALPGGGSRTIALSKRANIYYLDRVRVHVRNERVIYQVAGEGQLLDYNLPDCNTSLLLLGKGSSITDSAARCLAKSGVVVGFAGSGGTPPHCLMDYVFLNPADEYRPTEYCQKWVCKWMDHTWKIAAAKHLLCSRIDLTRKGWGSLGKELSAPFGFPDVAAEQFARAITAANNETDLLLAEAAWAKACYRHLAQLYKIEFSRQAGSGADLCNNLLDHGNYLMYGLATVSLHALGIPHAFPLLHGKTRRGALIFDVADLCKDGYVMPLAFWCAQSKDKKVDQNFRESLLKTIQHHDVLDKMIETIKSMCLMQVIDFEGIAKDS